LTPRCVQGHINEPYAFIAHSTSVANLDDRDVVETIAGQGSAAVDFFLVAGKAKTSFLIKNSGKATTESIARVMRFSAGRAGISSPGYTNSALFAPGASNDDRKRHCSDRWISSIELGAYFVWGASFVFKDEATAAHYRSTFSASALGGLVKRSKTHEETFTSAKSDVEFVVWGQQFGADEAMFRKQISRSEATEFELRCNRNGIVKCQDAFDRLEAYRLGKGGFTDQLAAAQTAPFKTLRALSATLSKYENFLP